MILTDNEMNEIRRSIEAQAGLDDELMQRCGPLIHMDQFDEAVRSACVLLEDRLRQAVNGEGMTGTRLAMHAFDPDDGPLAKHLGRNQGERKGLLELYSGAFRLFRNPTAHGLVGYSAAEGKAIIGFVNLLLSILKRAEELPPPDMFPEHVERALGKTEELIGPGAASRLRVFLGKGVAELGLAPGKAKQWIPFKKHCLYHAEHWEQARRHPITVFYFWGHDGKCGLSFPTTQFYANVVGFDVDQLVEELTDLGFRPLGTNQHPIISLKVHNDQAFFDALFNVVARTVGELDETLQQG